MKNINGQVWIESVIYILIGLALIGLVLAFVSPRINMEKDHVVIEQTIESLNILDKKIGEILEAGPGNVRIIEFGIHRGEIYFNSISDEIVFIINDLEEPYSEPGVELEIGRVKIISSKGQKKSSVNLTMNYGTIANLKFDKFEENKKFNVASTPYRFSIENNGKEGSLFDIINFGVLG